MTAKLKNPVGGKPEKMKNQLISAGFSFIFHANQEHRIKGCTSLWLLYNYSSG